MLGKSLRNIKQLNTMKTLMKNQSRILPVASRGYFSMMDRLKQKVHTPMKHLNAFFQPDGQNYESQLPSGYNLHGNSAAMLSASITNNALEMH